MANFLSIDEGIVDDIKVINTLDEVIIYIILKRKEYSCPCCFSNKNELKEYKIKKFNHSLFLGKETTFFHKYRRFKCLKCGKTFSEHSPFTPKKGKESYETIRLILDYARSYVRTWTDIAKLTHTSDTTTINIFDRYVNPPRGTLSRIMCIDECHNKGQFQKPYSAVFFNFLDKKLIDVIDGRNKNNLIHYFSNISKEERAMVEYIITDMWEPYLDVASILFPHAVVAIDSFHVIREIGFALDLIRRKVMRRYEKGTKEYFLLKKWHKVIYNHQDPYEDKQKVKGYGNKWLNPYDIQQLILKLDDDLAYAQHYYMLYRYHNEHSSKEEFTKKMDIFISDPKIHRIEQFIPVVNMLSNWKPWILNSFIRVDGNRLSNGPIEGFNSFFKKLLYVSNGLYTYQRFRNRLMYCYNHIDHISRVTPFKKPKRGKRGPYKKSSNPKK